MFFRGQDDVYTELFAHQSTDFLKAGLGIALQVRADFHLPTGKINVHGSPPAIRSSGFGTRVNPEF